ncbi:MAG: replication initiator protein [Arizlama microvirus]|nr:MAG: replication initiator protein [Arizlama microvirus]
MCLFPQNAELNEFGRISFTREGNLKLPCGKCTECISKRSFEWATRARHEISCHKENSFITLTYNEENLPSINSIKTEFQKFIKRLRKHTKSKIRYMVSHEYGSQTFRPHHHVILFGYNPPNQKYLKQTKKGEQLFTSQDVQKLWSLGFHSIGTANEKTAYYIANYSLKGKKHTLPDPLTGEMITISDSMDVSKRPAIGYNYFEKNYQQLIDSNAILPRYYFKKLQTLNPTLHEHYENKRLTQFKNRSSHEILAKFTIDNQKLDLSSYEFRDTNESVHKELPHYTKILKSTRDDYHHKSKENSK